MKRLHADPIISDNTPRILSARCSLRGSGGIGCNTVAEVKSPNAVQSPVTIVNLTPPRMEMNWKQASRSSINNSQLSLASSSTDREVPKIKFRNSDLYLQDRRVHKAISYISNERRSAKNPDEDLNNRPVLHAHTPPPIRQVCTVEKVDDIRNGGFISVRTDSAARDSEKHEGYRLSYTTISNSDDVTNVRVPQTDKTITEVSEMSNLNRETAAKMIQLKACPSKFNSNSETFVDTQPSKSDSQSGYDESSRPESFDADRNSLADNLLRPHEGPYVGLFNHGNTCYMSAILQCLRFTPAFFEICMSRSSESTKVLTSLTQLFHSMETSKSHLVLYDDIEQLRRQLSCTISLCSGSEQQDALEFLVCLLDTLHSELKQSNVDHASTLPSSSVADLTSIESNIVQPQEAPLCISIIQGDVQKPSKNNPSTRKKIRCIFRPFHAKKRDQKTAEGKQCKTKSSGVQPSEVGGTDPSVTKEVMHPANISWEEENRKEHSCIKDLFMGQIQTYRKCLECSLEKVSYGVVWNLSLPIPKCSPLVSVRSFDSTIPTNPDRSRTSSEQSNNSTSCDGSKNPTPPSTYSAKKRLTLFDDSNAPDLQSWKPDVTPSHRGELFGGSPGRVPPVSPPLRTQSIESIVPMTLTRCFRNDVITEILRDSDKPWCYRCNRKTKCLMQSTLSRLPKILIIHLLRFQCGEQRKKNAVHVSFDMKLDVREYMVSEYEKGHRFESHQLTEMDTSYRLYAVVYHDGVLCSGHYTAACRIPSTEEDEPDHWYLFDDECVKEIKPESVDRASAYILFYEKDSEYQKRKLQSMAKNV